MDILQSKKLLSWGIIHRQVIIRCKANSIDSATRWIIPENAEKPTNDKRKVEYDND